MLKLWRKRFSIASLSMRHEEPSVFVTSQWQRKPNPNMYYMAYRLGITLYLLIAWLLSIIDEQNLNEAYPFHVKWLIYLTNWGFTLCMLQAVLCTGMLWVRYVRLRNNFNEDNPSTLRLYQVYWVFFTIALDLSIAITILYWVIIYNPETMELDYLNILVHCTNSVAMVMELCVVSHPVRIMHCYLTVCAGFVYTLFSLIYYLAGGTSRIDEPYIYPVVDWRKPGTTVLVCLGACVFLVIIHCTCYLVYRIRIAISNKLMKTDSLPVQETFAGFDNEAV